MKQYTIEPGKNAIKAVDIPAQHLGPNDVKVRVKAASLNYRDILNLHDRPSSLFPTGRAKSLKSDPQ